MTKPNGATEGGSGGNNKTQYTRSELQTAEILIAATAKAPSSTGAVPIPASAAEAKSTIDQAVELPSTETIEKDSTSKKETPRLRVVPIPLPSIVPGVLPFPLPASQRVPIAHQQASNFPTYYNYSYRPYVYHDYHLPFLVQTSPPATATDSKSPQKSVDDKSKAPSIHKKRKRTMRRDSIPEGEEAAGGVVEDGKEKSERKRQREKQRRSELTNAFEDMHSFILRLDTDHGGDGGGGGEGEASVMANTNNADDNQNNHNHTNNADNGHGTNGHSPPHRRKNRRLSSRNTGGAEGDDGAMTTRVDLINRALTIMKRMYQENAEMKQALARTDGGHDKHNEVIVMVPTLTPADETAPPVARVPPGSFRPPYLPPGYGPPPQQDHSQPPLVYGGLPPSRYPPPHHQQPHGAWGPPYPGPPGRSGGPPPPPQAGHYGGGSPDQRGHRLPPQPPMEHHDARNIR